MRSSPSWTIFVDSGALVSATLVLLLVVPGATHASVEGQQVEQSTSSEPGERPAWLRPLGDEADSRAPHSGEPAEGDAGRRRAGWSELEPSVLDVQAWDWLQQDLVRMLDEARAHSPDRLSPKAFEEKFLGATVEFLEFDAEETKTFQTAVDKALDEIGEARADMLHRQVDPDVDETAAMLASRARWEAYTRAQRRAARYPIAALQPRPRHQLLREGMLTWLLRLNYGVAAR
jgi:hypothetical protein